MKKVLGLLISMMLVAPISVEFAAADSAQEEFDQLKDSCFIDFEGESGLEEECKKGPALAQEILKTDPNNIEILFKYSMLLDKANRRSEAIKVWQKILRLDPDHVESLYKLARRLYSADNKKKVELLKRVVELEPDHPRAHKSLAVNLITLGEGKKAAEAMKTHIQLIKKGVNLPWLDIQIDAFAANMERAGFAQELPDILIEYLSVYEGGEFICYQVKKYQKKSN